MAPLMMRPLTISSLRRDMDRAVRMVRGRRSVPLSDALVPVEGERAVRRADEMKRAAEKERRS